jgi:hypothetical protein
MRATLPSMTFGTKHKAPLARGLVFEPGQFGMRRST